MKSFLAGLCRLFVVLFVLFPGSALATKMYAIVTGDPSGGIPVDQFVYMDANEGCAAVLIPPPSTACERNHAPAFSVLGGQPTQPSACTHLWDCTCGTCQIGEPGDPRNFNKIAPSQTNAFGNTLSCPGPNGEYLGSCDPDGPKGKGDCKDCEFQQGNPANVGPGTKLQREAVYRDAGGMLELVLTYNSKPGVTYFRSGPFGRHWSSPFFMRVRDTGQGIVAVERPGGGEVEFRQPASGNVYVSQADANDRLLRVLNGSGQLLGWTVTAADGDRVEEHDGPASLKRAWFGTLTRILDRAQRQTTMTYSTAATPASIAPEPGLLIAVTDHYGRQLTFAYDANYRVIRMTDPAGGQYLFEYDGPTGPANANNLTKITFPDGKTRVLFYAEAAHINEGAACSPPPVALPNLLTGLQDEKGVRFATWGYDCFGRPMSSEHAGGVNRYEFTYPPGARAVQDPLGTTRTMSAVRVLSVPYNNGTQQPSASGTGNVSNARTRDAQGNLSSATDFNGNRTNYSYDLSRNLETSRTEGLTSAGGTTP